MFDIYLGQEDSLVFGDPMIIDKSIIDTADETLNRKTAKIDKKREEMLED